MGSLLKAGRWSAGLCALALVGCGDREGSEAAALALAEALYPGQFDLHASYLQKDHYDVDLVKKDDPLTRVRFSIDRDPADCRVGSACEQRLRRAYADGVSVGIKIKALNAGFAECGVPMLGIHDGRVMAGFRTIVELDLDAADQQPGLDRLAPCIAAFRRALPADADGLGETLALRVLRPAAGRPAGLAPLNPDSRLPRARNEEPSYMVAVREGQDTARAEELRLYVHYVSASGLDEHLADAARRALSDDPAGGYVPSYASSPSLKLDPQRLDVVHAYVLACSVRTSGQGPCRTDVAVRMRYDLPTGQASDVQVIRNIRDARGSVALPELPGR